MAASPRSLRPVPVALLAACVAVALVFAGCSSGSEEGGGDSTTSVTAPGTSVSTTTSTSGASTTTAEDDGPLPTSPSTLPTFDGPCAALAQTLGLDQIRPIDSSSWIDERQRVVVDAQRESQLLATAQTGAPGAIAAQLTTMEAYAAFVATAVGGADGYAQAVATIDGYPGRPGAEQAATAVAAWRRTSCA